ASRRRPPPSPASRFPARSRADILRPSLRGLDRETDLDVGRRRIPGPAARVPRGLSGGDQPEPEVDGERSVDELRLGLALTVPRITGLVEEPPAGRLARTRALLVEDRDLRGGVIFAAGLAVTAVLALVSLAYLGRRLSPSDFA